MRGWEQVHHGIPHNVIIYGFIKYMVVTVDTINQCCYHEVGVMRMSREKTPLQVYLDQRQLGTLRYLAKKRDTSMAEIVRESIAKYLIEIPVEEDPAMGIVGMIGSGRSDISENHDAYLTEALLKENSYPIGGEVQRSRRTSERRGRREGGNGDAK